MRLVLVRVLTFLSAYFLNAPEALNHGATARTYNIGSFTKQRFGQTAVPRLEMLYQRDFHSKGPVTTSQLKPQAHSSTKSTALSCQKGRDATPDPSSTPPQAPPSLHPRCPFRKFIRRTLENSVKLSQLSPFQISLFRAFLKNPSEPCRCLYKYMFEHYPFEMIWSKKNDRYFLSSLINTTFRQFSKAYPNLAQKLVEQIVVPEYPFLSTLPYRFDINVFLCSTHQSLDEFLSATTSQIFNQKCSEIFNKSFDPSYDSQSEFYHILGEYERAVPWLGGQYKYACDFLNNVNFEYVKHVALRRLGHLNYDYYFGMDHFASCVYEEVHLVAPGTAEQALRSILPSVYDTIKGRKRYHVVIGAFLDHEFGQLNAL